MAETPLSTVACVSRVVTRVVDRIAGDRAEVPLMVAAACVEALRALGVESRVMYGPAAWIEILEDHSPVWAGCWGESCHFWVATEHGEVVDLNASVAHRKRAHSNPSLRSLYSPPIVWSRELPRFYRCSPEGIAELELTEESDRQRFERVLSEVRERCKPEPGEPEFPNEAILCPGRRVLDDSRGTFRSFDRALGVHGIPPAPF